MFSCGAIIFKLATGKSLIKSSNKNESQIKSLSTDFSRMITSELIPNNRLRILIKGLLEPRPLSRLSAAQALQLPFFTSLDS